LAALDPTLRLRRNAPYRGVSDGLPTTLRRRFGNRYLGMELEVNQRFVLTNAPAFACLNRQLATSLERALDAMSADGSASPHKILKKKSVESLMKFDINFGQVKPASHPFEVI